MENFNLFAEVTVATDKDARFISLIQVPTICWAGACNHGKNYPYIWGGGGDQQEGW